MRSYTAIKKTLGTKGALQYLRDYHQQRINTEGTWADAIYTLESYGADEREVATHAQFMNECGSDFIKYAWRNQQPRINRKKKHTTRKEHTQ